VIDVLPEALGDRYNPTAKIRVHVSRKTENGLERDTSPQIQIVPLGQAASDFQPEIDAPNQAFLSKQIVSLDGHVFVEWSASKRLAIATFSQGGGPPTGSPVNGAPITAGSADGNLMIFFEGRGDAAYKRGDHAEVRVITTRQPGIDKDLSESTEPGAEPRGYAFSLGSNGPLPLDNKPTLVISYDKRTELDDGEPVIHRLLENGKWQPIPSYRPRGAWYVAAPLNEETAPGLTRANVPNEARVERFRIFLVRRRFPTP
jgi:hypothetical protein